MVMAIDEKRILGYDGKVYNIGDLLKDDNAPPMNFCPYCGKKPIREPGDYV
jgi:hypothetical protein